MQVAQVCVLLVAMMLVQVVQVAPDALVAAIVAAIVAAVVAAVVAMADVPAAVPGVPVHATDALALVTVHVGQILPAVGRVVHFVPQCVKVQVQTKKEE